MRHEQPVAAVHDVGRVAVRGEVGLDAVEVDPQPADLGETAAPADDLDEPVGVKRARSPVRSASTSGPRARSAGDEA